MSSLRNAVKRVTHKERSQPTRRAHLGILEKKKDYRIRAQDFHRKENALANLRNKAAERNPDEFYFGMKTSEVRDGKHRKTMEARNEQLEDQIGPEAVKIMKTQDLSYVRMQIGKDAKLLERMKSSLQFLGENPYTENMDENNYRDAASESISAMRKLLKKRKHTIFLDSKDKAENFNVADHFDTLPELAGRTFNRPRKAALIKAATNGESFENLDDDMNSKLSEKEIIKKLRLEKKNARKISKARNAAYKAMEAREGRMATLKNAEGHLITEKIIASKGRKRKVAGGEDGKPAIYKFRRKRSK
mmetsp:Transcript_23030/g.32444  ORF Transcript_23030/g.32444 Transcript_23030/m.32444 type:complete len:304 (+) Transcript_23030:132-1043(+)|eukprot:CAMPEP_0184864020 /NCGR_PEP_ID=MMETSP0580-20130426/13408_1 /TAXON_ID=1118495 /ORGANISM="Dactyliosolen fragilissimus" /LENGTH=303 /DNA_ID=CAMNT_0027362647 /DNA_START=108 /DNA_END=1019 /DNA_ORIENTATION=+